MLWMFKRVFFGPKGELVKDEHHPLHDLSIREIAVMVPLVLMVFWMGLFPNHFLDYSKTSIDFLVNNKNNYHLSISGSQPATEVVQAAEGEQ
ncbi:NADH:ubiquinone oxidoreductase subunit M [compost metagenome]